jgi:GTP cyclohydrolase I
VEPLMAGEKIVIKASEVEELVKGVSYKIRANTTLADIMDRRTLKVFGVPRGGIPVAMALVSMLDCVQVDDPTLADVIVDDILDSGATLGRYNEKCPGVPFYCMIEKIATPKWTNKWIVLPWEVTENNVDRSADDIVLRLLQFINEDPNREGLRETPRRVLKAWKEWAQGYGVDPKTILKTFKDGAENCGDEFVIVRNIPIISKCEHHLADITGTAHVGYIPNGRIVGLSKLARLADLFARRLQVQERLTNQIADALDECLEPKGVGVVIHAAHACMSSRGVKIQGSITTTSAMRGVCLTNPAARHEFLSLCEARS